MPKDKGDAKESVQLLLVDLARSMGVSLQNAAQLSHDRHTYSSLGLLPTSNHVFSTINGLSEKFAANCCDAKADRLKKLGNGLRNAAQSYTDRQRELTSFIITVVIECSENPLQTVLSSQWLQRPLPFSDCGDCDIYEDCDDSFEDTMAKELLEISQANMSNVSLGEEPDLSDWEDDDNKRVTRPPQNHLPVLFRPSTNFLDSKSELPFKSPLQAYASKTDLMPYSRKCSNKIPEVWNEGALCEELVRLLSGVPRSLAFVVDIDGSIHLKPVTLDSRLTKDGLSLVSDELSRVTRALHDLNSVTNIRYDSYTLQCIRTWLTSFIQSSRRKMAMHLRSAGKFCDILDSAIGDDVIQVRKVLSPMFDVQMQSYMQIQQLYKITFAAITIANQTQMQLMLDLFMAVRAPLLTFVDRLLVEDIQNLPMNEFPFVFQRGILCEKLCHCPVFSEILPEIVRAANIAAALKQSNSQWLQKDALPSIKNSLYKLFSSETTIFAPTPVREPFYSFLYGCYLPNSEIYVHCQSERKRVVDVILVSEIVTRIHGFIHENCQRIDASLIQCLLTDYHLKSVLHQTKQIFSCVVVDDLMECLYKLKGANIRPVNEVGDSLNMALKSRLCDDRWTVILKEETSTTPLHLSLHNKSYSLSIQPNICWPSGYSPLTSVHIARYNASLTLILALNNAQHSLVGSMFCRSKVLMGWQLECRVVKFLLLNLLRSVEWCLLYQLEHGFAGVSCREFTSLEEVMLEQDKFTASVAFLQQNSAIINCIHAIITSAHSFMQYQLCEAKCRELSLSFYKYRSFLCISLANIKDDNPSRKCLVNMILFGKKSTKPL